MEKEAFKAKIRIHGRVGDQIQIILTKDGNVILRLENGNLYLAPVVHHLRVKTGEL